jgi:hypothetical protein
VLGNVDGSLHLLDLTVHENAQPHQAWNILNFAVLEFLQGFIFSLFIKTSIMSDPCGREHLLIQIQLIIYTCHLYVNAFDIICTLFYLKNTMCTTKKCNSVYPLYISKIRFRISPVYVEYTFPYIICICRKYDPVYPLYMKKLRFRISYVYVEKTSPYILCICSTYGSVYRWYI